jgi:hypothetical protein
MKNNLTIWLAFSFQNIMTYAMNVIKKQTQLIKKSIYRIEILLK